MTFLESTLNNPTPFMPSARLMALVDLSSDAIDNVYETIWNSNPTVWFQEGMILSSNDKTG